MSNLIDLAVAYQLTPAEIFSIFSLGVALFVYLIFVS